MRLKYRKDIKKCPRCQQKCLTNQKSCNACGLIFSRLEQATNKEARKQFFNKDKSVVMVKDFPSDVKRWKLVLWCLFLGIFGAHCLSVGRYYRGGYMLIIGIASVVLSLVSYSSAYETFMSYFFIFPAILVLFWMVDLFNICFGFFKVPVALPID